MPQVSHADGSVPDSEEATSRITIVKHDVPIEVIEKGRALFLEPPRLLRPKLAAIVGDTEAIFLDHLNDRVTNKAGTVVQDRVWYAQTYFGWAEELGFRNADHIRRIIKGRIDKRRGQNRPGLEARGIIIIAKLADKLSDRTNYMRIDYGVLGELATEYERNFPSGPKAHMDARAMPGSTRAMRAHPSGPKARTDYIEHYAAASALAAAADGLNDEQRECLQRLISPPYSLGFDGAAKAVRLRAAIVPTPSFAPSSVDEIWHLAQAKSTKPKGVRGMFVRLWGDGEPRPSLFDHQTKQKGHPDANRTPTVGDDDYRLPRNGKL